MKDIYEGDPGLYWDAQLRYPNGKADPEDWMEDDEDDEDDEAYEEDEDDDDEDDDEDDEDEDDDRAGLTEEEYDFKAEIAYLDSIFCNLNTHSDLSIDGYDDEDYYWLGDRNRLRERIYFRGFQSLKLREQIEMILFYVMPKGDLKEITQRIADHFGSVQKMLNARLEDFEGLDIPRVCKVWLMMVGRLVRSYLKYDRKRFKPVFRYIDLMKVVAKLRQERQWPQTCMLYADFEYHIMACDKISDSTYWMDPEITRKVIKNVVSIQAKYVFLVFLCGPDPVEMDDDEKAYLVSFAAALKAIGVELLDCVIASDFGLYSLTRDGKFDILHREDEWRRTKKSCLYNYNTPRDNI